MSSLATHTMLHFHMSLSYHLISVYVHQFFGLPTSYCLFSPSLSNDLIRSFNNQCTRRPHVLTINWLHVTITLHISVNCVPMRNPFPKVIILFQNTSHYMNTNATYVPLSTGTHLIFYVYHKLFGSIFHLVQERTRPVNLPLRLRILASLVSSQCLDKASRRVFSLHLSLCMKSSHQLAMYCL